MTHAIALALVAAGCAVVAASVVGAVVVRGDVFLRLHFVTPATSLGVPLLAVGLCIQSGQPWVVAEVLLIALLLGAAGPVLEAAMARTAAQRHGVIASEQPE